MINNCRLIPYCICSYHARNWIMLSITQCTLQPLFLI